MKKLIIAAAVMALSIGVNAQEKEGGDGTIGGVDNTTIAAGVVGIAVAAAIISNNRGSSVTQPPVLCDDGSAPVNGVCPQPPVTSTNTVTSTVTATF